MELSSGLLQPDGDSLMALICSDDFSFLNPGMMSAQDISLGALFDLQAPLGQPQEGAPARDRFYGASAAAASIAPAPVPAPAPATAAVQHSSQITPPRSSSFTSPRTSPPFNTTSKSEGTSASTRASRARGSGKRRVSVRLVPHDDDMAEAVRREGYNPLLELNTPTRKCVGFLQSHLATKWARVRDIKSLRLMLKPSPTSTSPSADCALLPSDATIESFAHEFVVADEDTDEFVLTLEYSTTAPNATLAAQPAVPEATGTVPAACVGLLPMFHAAPGGNGTASSRNDVTSYDRAQTPSGASVFNLCTLNNGRGGRQKYVIGRGSVSITTSSSNARATSEAGALVQSQVSCAAINVLSGSQLKRKRPPLTDTTNSGGNLLQGAGFPAADFSSPSLLKDPSASGSSSASNYSSSCEGQGDLTTSSTVSACGDRLASKHKSKRRRIRPTLLNASSVDPPSPQFVQALAMSTTEPQGPCNQLSNRCKANLQAECK